MKKISIVIPAYNAERTLAEALESIYASETYMRNRSGASNLEIVIVDGGSTDTTGELIRAFRKKDSRIRSFWLSSEAGIMTCRKTGVTVAEGDYLMFLDADDRYLPETLDKAYTEMERTHADIIQFATRILPEGQVPLNEILLKERKLGPAAASYKASEEDTYAVLNACYKDHSFTYTLWNKIYRMELAKAAFERIPEEKLVMGEDMYAFFLISSRAGSMSIIEDRLYEYRFGQGISCVNKKDPWDAFEKSLEAMRSLKSLAYVLTRDHEEDCLKAVLPELSMDLLMRTLSRFYCRLDLSEPGMKERADARLRLWWSEEELLRAGYISGIVRSGIAA